jgi:hypothetical protein
MGVASLVASRNASQAWPPFRQRMHRAKLPGRDPVLLLPCAKRLPRRRDVRSALARMRQFASMVLSKSRSSAIRSTTRMRALLDLVQQCLRLQRARGRRAGAELRSRTCCRHPLRCPHPDVARHAFDQGAGISSGRDRCRHSGAWWNCRPGRTRRISRPACSSRCRHRCRERQTGVPRRCGLSR